MPKEISPVTIPDSEMRTLISSQTDKEYRISVAFPDGYGENNQLHTACYVLDSQYFFGMATEYSRILAAGQEIPPLLIIGIGFPVPESEVGPHRKWNYVPTGWNDEEGIGGAQDFMQFIREDLIPFVESEYRVDPSDRLLFGDSRGGLFVLYALLQQSKIFNRFVVGSPWFTQDNPEEVLRYEDNYAASHADLAATIFMAAGSLEPEPVISNIYRLDKILQDRGYNNLRLKTHIFEGETHLSVTSHNLCKGLKLVYA